MTRTITQNTTVAKTGRVLDRGTVLIVTQLDANRRYVRCRPLASNDTTMAAGASSKSEAHRAAEAGSHGIQPSYRILESVRERLDDGELDTLRKQLQMAVKFYPQLAPKTITVGCRKQPGAEHSRWTPYASAEPVNYMIRLPTNELPSHQVVFHELAHVEIYERERFGASLPTSSEEFCSIYAVARMPHELLFDESISYLGKPSVPKDEWPRICRDALAYRADHGANSHYIQKCKEWLQI